MSIQIAFDSYTVQYHNVSRFAAVTFRPKGVKPRDRKNTVTVQEPVLLVARRDGKFTIKARNKVNTRTINARGGTLKFVDFDGKTQTLTV